METVRSLVQNLVVIIILAIFLDLFLPSGDMKRYVKFVMGLLVIIAVLGALGSIFKGDWVSFLPEQATGKDEQAEVSLGEIMARAEKINQNRQVRMLEEYRRAIARQVSALAGLYPDVGVQDVEVDVYAEEKDPKFGQIKEIRLAVKNFRTEEERLAGPQVKIQIGAGDNQVSSGAGGLPEGTGVLAPETKKKLQIIIANYYNLQPDQVRVTDAK
ncbi:MAG: stage III sporulation protein AF [Desulfotomaculales bacterium]